MAEQINPTREHFSLLGLLVSRKTDLIAIVALLLSLITIVGSFFFYIQNSVVDVFLPEQVQFLVDDCEQKEFRYVGVILPVTIINTGKYGDALMSEKLFMSIKSKTMQLYPYRVVKTKRQYRSQGYCNGRKTGEFRGTDISSIGTPMRAAVRAGSVISREILYIADSKKCGEKLDRCLPHPTDQYIGKEDMETGSKIVIQLRMKFLNDGVKNKACRVEMRKDSFSAFSNYETVTTRPKFLGILGSNRG